MDTPGAASAATAAAAHTATTLPQTVKRRRINFACNYCRSRKTRCDEGIPSCHACLAVGVPCVTTDKRRPGVEVKRSNRPPTPANPSSVTASVASSNSRPAFQLAPTASPTPSSIPGADVPIPLPSQSWVDPQRHTSELEDDEGDFLSGEPLAHTSSSRVRFAGRLPVVLRVAGQDTLHLLTGWLEIALRRLGMRQSSFQPWLSVKDSNTSLGFLELGLAGGPPPFPPTEAALGRLQVFLRDIHPVLPLLSPDGLHSVFHRALRLGATELARSGDYVTLLRVYLVLALTMPPEVPEGDAETQAYIAFCKSLIGHIVCWASLEVVQLVLMLAVVLLVQDQTAAAWSVMTLCVSLATTLHLHRATTSSSQGSSSTAAILPSENVSDTDANRTWWAIYAFEKLLAFSLGRPSAIQDYECDQPVPEPATQGNSASSTESSNDGPHIFPYLVTLAQRVSAIHRDGLRARRCEETMNVQDKRSIEAAIYEKIRVTGEAVLAITQWADSLPAGYRPHTDYICSPHAFSAVAFLSTQYCTILIMLQRNTLLLSDRAFRHSVDVATLAKKPWAGVVRRGSSVAVHAARLQVRILLEAADSGHSPALLSLFAPLNAVYVLSIHLLTHPQSRLVDSDLSLIHHASGFAKQRYERTRSDRAAHAILNMLHDLVQQKLAASCPSQAMPGSRSTGSGHSAFAADGDTPTLMNTPVSRTDASASNNNNDNESNSLLSQTPTGDTTGLTGSMNMLLPDDISWDWGDFWLYDHVVQT
ncbi:hypothetical protein SEUCBS140593_003020 [Sporothrix eucalyptigena]|uniref:Zn(2)-C6 fungal-type domain-containing protein n=1 Tax=Sporothrix eucalyptigena TaxID=1812306 RepID=A0ABP0BBJ8_9PEZI